MKYSKYLLAAAVTTLSAFASAETINFDDLSPVQNGSVIANGYHGFDWDNFYVTQGSDYPASGFTSGTVSAPNVAFNGDFGSSASFSSASAFTLVSMDVTRASLAGLTHFDGYVGNTLTYQIDIASSTTSPTLALFGWTGLSRVTMSDGTNAPEAFSGVSAIDNLTVTAAVPEPETYALLLAGLGLIAGAVRRRKVQGLAA